MSQYVSGGAVESMGSSGEGEGLGGFVLTCIFWATVGIAMVTLTHKVYYPNPMGYLCSEVEGVAEVKYGRKGRSDSVNGVKRDARSCVLIELPHNR